MAQSKQAFEASEPGQKQDDTTPLVAFQLDASDSSSSPPASELCQDLGKEGQQGPDTPDLPNMVAQARSPCTQVHGSVLGPKLWAAIISLASRSSAVIWSGFIFAQDGPDTAARLSEVMQQQIDDPDLDHLDDLVYEANDDFFEQLVDTACEDPADVVLAPEICKGVSMVVHHLESRHDRANWLKTEWQRWKVFTCLLEEAQDRFKDQDWYSWAYRLQMEEGSLSWQAISAAEEAKLDAEVEAAVEELLSSKMLDIGSFEACHALESFSDGFKHLLQRVASAAKDAHLGFMDLRPALRRWTFESVDPLVGPSEAWAWLAETEETMSWLRAHHQTADAVRQAEYMIALYEQAAEYLRHGGTGVLETVPYSFRTPHGRSGTAKPALSDRQPASDSHRAAMEPSAYAAASLSSGTGHTKTPGKDQVAADKAPVLSEATAPVKVLEHAEAAQTETNAPDPAKASQALDLVSC